MIVKGLGLFEDWGDCLKTRVVSGLGLFQDWICREWGNTKTRVARRLGLFEK